MPGYSNISKRCLLCLTEKVVIATYENLEELLNKRSELMAKSHHNNKFLLSNYKSNDWIDQNYHLVRNIVVIYLIIEKSWN